MFVRARRFASPRSFSAASTLLLTGALGALLLVGGCKKTDPVAGAGGAGGMGGSGNGAGAVAGQSAAEASGRAPAAPRATDEEVAARASFDMLSNRVLEGFLHDDPGWGRQLGLHEYDGKVPDFSASALLLQAERLHRFRDELAAVPVGLLDLDRTLDLALLQARVEQEVFARDDLDVFHTRPGAYETLFAVDVYLTRAYAPLSIRLEKLVAHEEAALKQSKQWKKNLSPVLAKPIVETAIKIFGGYADYLEKDVPKQVGSFDDKALERKFVTVNAQLAKEARAFATWLEKDALPKADQSHVLGKDRFQKLLRVQEGLDTPLAELSRMAEDDLERNKKAYAALPPATERVRPTADELLATATRVMEDARRFVLEKNIVTLPDQERATVKESPPFMRWNSAFLDGPGPFEKAAGAFYYITLPDPSWPPAEQTQYVPLLGSLTATTVHEVYPGHFVQGRWERRAPTRVQRMLGSYSFTEGWAHYAEQMMVEEGFSQSVETQYGQLEDALLRNCRFVVSIGIHTAGMNAEEAERRFREDCHQDAATARQQAARGAFDPGYFAYTLGKLQILALREQVKTKLGPKFSLRNFHNALLGHGTPAVPLLTPFVWRDLGLPAPSAAGTASTPTTPAKKGAAQDKPQP
jgi:uncharacterized protein (DUF885 family)